MTEVVAAAKASQFGFVPTVTKQCWGFMVGSTLFALGSAPGLSTHLGANGANIVFFFGALFFTAAGLIQLFLSGAVSVPVSYGTGRMVRAEWLAAAIQSFGTVMFNISTSDALYARSLRAEEKLVWNPTAAGSAAFLVSGFVAIIAYAHVSKPFDPTRIAWWSVMINLAGCIAFAFSTVGSYIKANGEVYDDTLANWGTFIGALCFFVASLVVLPWWSRNRATPREAQPAA